MKGDKTKTEHVDTPIVTEPGIAYQTRGPFKNRLIVHASFDEQKEEEYEFIRDQSPSDRLRDAVALIRQVYKEELRNYVPSKRITIIHS